MNLYEELDKFRQVIPAGDHRGCGFHMYSQGENIRKFAMRTLSESVLPGSKNELREDAKRTDNDTVFFFRTQERAKDFWGYALGIGLSEGEVVYDPTIDPRLGVGEYAIRVMPHVKDTKSAVLLALFRKAQGRNVPAGQFWEWMQKTGGALEVELAEEGVVPYSDDPVDHPSGRATGRTVAELTQMAAGMKSSDVHTISTVTAGDEEPGEEFRSSCANAQKTFVDAQRSVGTDFDFVNDGTNGTPLNGGAGAVQGGAGIPTDGGMGSGMQSEARRYARADRQLSEELLRLGSGCDLGAIAQLAGLRG